MRCKTVADRVLSSRPSHSVFARWPHRGHRICTKASSAMASTLRHPSRYSSVWFLEVGSVAAFWPKQGDLEGVFIMDYSTRQPRRGCVDGHGKGWMLSCACRCVFLGTHRSGVPLSVTGRVTMQAHCIISLTSTRSCIDISIKLHCW